MYVSSVGNPWRAGVGIVIRYSYVGFVAARAIYFGDHTNMYADILAL